MRPATRLSAFICSLGLLLPCALAHDASAAEVDLLNDGLSFADCLDPDATIPGGFPVEVLCNTRVYGPADEFRGVQSKILTRGGAFNWDLRSNLLTAARPGLGESRFTELQGQLVDEEFLESGSLGVFRALSAAAARARDAGDTATADELQAQADALVAGTFDEASNIRELLAALEPHHRRRELLPPEFPGILTREFADTVSHFGIRLATDVFKVSGTGALSAELARRATVPFLVGPDGLRNTADDLPIFDPTKGMRAVQAGPAGGGNPFPDTDYDDVIVVDQDGTDVRFFGRLRDDVIVQIGCGELGGTLNADGTCNPPADSDLMGDAFAEQVFKSGCGFQTGEFAQGGVDGEGRCIRLGVFFTVPFEGVPVFGDLTLRPEGAELEPFDLTDFMLIAKGEGKGLPARPRSPLGTLTFPNPHGESFARRVDPVTGAPVNATGELLCLYRDLAGDPTPDPNQSVGPNGLPSDGDDFVPSIGNCLLFDDPTDPNQPQMLRAAEAIALSHPANQILVHTLCTLSFDPIIGLCLIDQLDLPGLFSIVSNLLAGGEISTFFIDGFRGTRTLAAPFDGFLPEPEMRNAIVQQVAGADLSNLPPKDKANLGCGDPFVSPCGDADFHRYLADPPLQRLLGGRGSEQLGGGLDLMNADADFLTREYVTRKELESGGDGEPLPWLSDPNWLAQGVLVYQVANQNQLDPRCPEDPNEPATDPVCFNDQGSRKVRVFNDPTDVSNPLNVFRPSLGKSCIQNFGDTARFLSGQRAAAFDTGCAELDKLSANIERLSIMLDSMGYDRVPDPPESLEELLNLLDGDPNNDLTGDPMAGPDGIFVANLASGLGNLIDPGRFETGEKEMQVVRIEVNPVTAGIGLVKLDDFTGSPVSLEARETERIAAAMETFLADYDPDSCGLEVCHLVVAGDDQLNAVDAVEVQTSGSKEVVSVLPVALQLTFVEFDDAGNPSGGGIGHFNMAVLNIDDPIAFQELLDPEFRDPTAPPGLEGTVEVEIDGQTLRLFTTTSIRDRFLGEGNDGVDCQDLDNDGICDFDQDGDGVWDGADDYSRGPVTDDRILCGSGLPGDLLQDAMQFEFARPSDQAVFAGIFPQGLPPRSPVFCPLVQKFLGVTGPIGPYERSFIWHGAARIDDPEADGWPDALDVCPFVPDAGQTDSGGVGTSTPDGIGDACQCGDALEDGIIDANDILLLRLHLAFPSIVLTAEELEMCNRIAVTGACDILEVTLLRRATVGLAPGVGQTCEFALAP